MSKRKRKSGDKRRRHHISSRRGRRLAAGAGLTIGATLAAGGTAQAADFTVTSLADTGGTCDLSGCTLRSAIDAANLNPADSDRILFASDLSGSIDLIASLPPITGPVSIYGPGPDQLAVSGGGAFPIFHFDAPSHFNASIEALTLRGGSTSASGGAIDNDGANLSVRGSVITGNHAGGAGGGIYSDYYLLLAGSVVSNNTAGGAGGGIEANSQITPGNQLAVSRSTISHNHAGGSGGAIDISGSGGNITDSTFSFNDADLGGGAIEDNSTQLFAGYSTFDHNHADGSGGAVEAPGASGFFGTHQATLSYNSAGASGGAVDVAGPFQLRQTTVADNSAVNSGGGVHSSGLGTPGLYNTIVASDAAATDPDLAGAFDAQFSLVEATAAATLNTTVTGSNIFGLDPQLGPLANNGGLTLTRALPLTSPAVDQGTRASYQGDQRFLPRSIDLPTIANSTAAGADASDIGAFELQQGPAAPGGTTGSPGSSNRPKCEGKKATIVPRGKHGRLLSGTSGRDVIVGTDRDESIGGGGGNDIICAGGGDDSVKGGAGNDRLYGEDGEDTLLGQAGRDLMVGGERRDICIGGPGKDTRDSC
jgi:CSLREA domain-containing protein